MLVSQNHIMVGLVCVPSQGSCLCLSPKNSVKYLGDFHSLRSQKINISICNAEMLITKLTSENTTEKLWDTLLQFTVQSNPISYILSFSNSQLLRCDQTRKLGYGIFIYQVLAICTYRQLGYMTLSILALIKTDIYKRFHV